MGRGSESTGLDCSEEEQKAVDDIIVDHLGKVISSFPLPQSRAHTNPNTILVSPESRAHTNPKPMVSANLNCSERS